MDKKIYFLHIPRSGGTTMYNILKNIFPELKKTSNGVIKDSKGKWLHWPLFEKEKIMDLYFDSNILFNELPLDNSSNLNVFYFSIIRNPIDRFISNIQCNLNPSLEKIDEIILKFCNNVNNFPDKYGIFTSFTTYEKISIEKRYEVFYENIKKFIIFNLEDADYSNKIGHYFKNFFNIDLCHKLIPVCHGRHKMRHLNYKLNFEHLKYETQEVVKNFLKHDIICYNYLLSNNSYKMNY